ncbi:MAG TPA: sigma 54-interacting transcriptional regulator, partial [Thermotogota bacterium]|nr:sigma 54-interacting transcriptional regulator [Thermotogota bacterium]HRW93228.1 sigma 54-interacting transcriptional regulator [Thermotogota bacterium]
GGVVFLDEIGDVPLSMQPKLLTYLDDMVVQMSGWSDPKEIIAPVIIIAATNRNLKEAVRQGTFREDLYHRFTYRLRLPDLKDRRDDFRFLLSYALQKRNQLEGENIARISIQAIEKLERYDYPGNFRELESVVSRAIARAAIMERTIILAEDIDFA